MAAITTSELVESISHGGTKRNLYKYTLDNGEVHYRRGWIAETADNATDMAMRAASLPDELAISEFDQVIS